MYSELNWYVADAVIADRIKLAERFRRSRAGPGETEDEYEVVTVRLARPADSEAIARLAARDGHRAPVGSTLVAEAEGELRAARSLAGGASVADPFTPTAHLAELLELRATQLMNAASGKAPGSGRGLLARLRALTGRRGAIG